jgi:hypothetical protein
MKGQSNLKGLTVKTHLKAGAAVSNHNETLVRDRGKGLTVKTHLKAGGTPLNHNETLVRDSAN